MTLFQNTQYFCFIIIIVITRPRPRKIVGREKFRGCLYASLRAFGAQLGGDLRFHVTDRLPGMSL